MFVKQRTLHSPRSGFLGKTKHYIIRTCCSKGKNLLIMGIEELLLDINGQILFHLSGDTLVIVYEQE